MVFYALLLITLIVAALSLFVLDRAFLKHYNISPTHLFLATSVAIFIYLYGVWVYLSVYLKYIFVILFIITLIIKISSKRGNERTVALATKLLNGVFGLLFLALSVLYFTGILGKTPTVNMVFPFKKGTYFVLQGGKGLPANMFHYSYRGAVYAMDIAKLNKYGNRASSVFSEKLTDYEIYNDTIYSPCNGTVIMSRDNNPDNIPPSRERGPSNTNSVTIQTPSYYLFMAHLGYKKVFVREGDTIAIGDPIGLVGNSGFTLEPHLHLQAHRNTKHNLEWYQEKPLFIQFESKEYLLFETIEKN